MNYTVKFHQVIDLPEIDIDVSLPPRRRFEDKKKASRAFLKENLSTEGGVYFLIEDGIVIYAGRSINLQNRVRTHLANAYLASRVDSVAVQFIDDVPTQSIIEAIAIKEFMPELNVTGKTV